MGIEKFKKGLEDLSHTVESAEQDRLVISFVIPEGRFAGQQVRIGFQVPGDFDMTCPGGPHISPRLIPINTGAMDNSRSAESPFGAEWQYLSRPFNQWALKRTVKRYMEHVTDILNKL